MKLVELRRPILERQYHFPTTKLIDKQSAFRASVGDNKSFGGIKKSSYNKRNITEEFHPPPPFGMSHKIFWANSYSDREIRILVPNKDILSLNEQEYIKLAQQIQTELKLFDNHIWATYTGQDIRIQTSAIDGITNIVREKVDQIISNLNHKHKMI